MSPRESRGIATRTSVSSFDPSREVFAELEVGEGSFGGSGSTLSSQTIAPLHDDVRALFSDMRHIARQGSWYNLDRSEIFYKQARFMEEFTDDFYDEVEFSHYFPSYRDMNYAQLRTYFTWRTKVRSGRITEASVSYAFLYIYELLNTVGVSGPQEGLEKLTEFWGEFRCFNPLIDRYVLPWLKDYHVFYPLDHSFQEFVIDQHIEEHYPTVFCYTSDKANSFELFSRLSAYKVKKSIFYTEETKELFHECFFFVLERLRALFQTKRKRFEDYLFYVMKRKAKWSPFDKALFFPTCDQQDRTVRLSDREVYHYENQKWTTKSVLPSEQGRQLVGYIIKEMEAYLRSVKQFKYKLSADFDSCKAVDQNEFEKLGISIPQVVRESCAAFYELHTRKTVSVDLGNLAQIRKDALDVQGKLLVPEEAELRKIDLSSHEKPALSESYPKDHRSGQDTTLNTGTATPLTNLAAPQQTNGWTLLRDALTETEAQALRLVTQGDTPKELALQAGIMLEVLIDSINQKAMDCIGDTIMELGDTVELFDEYRNDLEKIMAE